MMFIINLLNKIPKDKILHILVSLLIYKLVYLCTTLIIDETTKAVISSILITLFLTIVIKEVVYDLVLKKGTFDLYDIVANIVGILIAIL